LLGIVTWHKVLVTELLQADNIILLEQLHDEHGQPFDHNRFSVLPQALKNGKKTMNSTTTIKYGSTTTTTIKNGSTTTIRIKMAALQQLQSNMAGLQQQQSNMAAQDSITHMIKTMRAN
jgi:hypothetical protein